MANNVYGNLGQYYKDIQDAGNVMTSVPKPTAPQVNKPVQQIPMPPVRKQTSPAIGLLLQQLLQSARQKSKPVVPRVVGEARKSIPDSKGVITQTPTTNGTSYWKDESTGQEWIQYPDGRVLPYANSQIPKTFGQMMQTDNSFMRPNVQQPATRSITNVAKPTTPGQQARESMRRALMAQISKMGF